MAHLRSLYAEKLVHSIYVSRRPFREFGMSVGSRLLVSAVLVTGPMLFAGAHAESVSVPPFRSIELRGGGHVTLRPGTEQRVTILSGSTRYTKFRRKDDGQLVIDACDRNCPDRYDLQIEIVTPEIHGVAVSGGGEIVSARGFGHQDSIGVAVEGGGAIDVRSIPVSRAEAAVNGGGAIRLRAERQLEAAVDGGGDIRYWGNPAVTSAVDGGGNVSRGG
jgi:hypothetical protein